MLEKIPKVEKGYEYVLIRDPEKKTSYKVSIEHCKDGWMVLGERRHMTRTKEFNDLIFCYTYFDRTAACLKQSDLIEQYSKRLEKEKGSK